MKHTFCAVALALVLAFANAAVEQAPHILTNMPPPSADISTGFFFPNNPDNKFPAGKLVRDCGTGPRHLQASRDSN